MIKEITEFVKELPPEFKSLGAKPKDGLHILLKIQESKEGGITVENDKAEYEYYLKKKRETISPFLKHCIILQELSWTLDFEIKPYYQKCFDLPEKGILSISPYCFSTKRKSLKDGTKYDKDKRKINERVERYFANTKKLITDIKSDEYRKALLNYLSNWSSFENFLLTIPEFADMGEEEHVILYLDLPIGTYDGAYSQYLNSYIFNNKKRFYGEGEELGVSNFFNGFNEDKPFLKHCTSPFDYSGLINKNTAKELKEFKDLLKQETLPNPLPVFVFGDELQDEAIRVFKTSAEDGVRIGYQAIIEKLYKEHKDELGNYYLLFYDQRKGEIKDFDFISKFEYELKDEEGEAWEIRDWFSIDYKRNLENVFDIQHTIIDAVFGKSIVEKTKTGIYYRYFGDIESKSVSILVLAQSYRQAFYDFIYKSKRQAVTQHTFNHILQTSVLEDVRLDEIKNNHHSHERNIRQKLNIWFSLSEKFNLHQNKAKETMASKLQEHRAFMRALAKGEASIQTDDQYAFAVGQVIYYLLSKSRTADRSYKRLEPFLQQVHAAELNKAIARLFDTYKHETFSNKFRNPFAEVMDYETKKNLRDIMPSMLAGIFSKNELFSDKEYQEVAVQVEEEESIA
ncbi:hypothetical protein [Rufibacter quisquiliarum]|uniref:CRISPR-associated protein Csh1 n=1 Tax=Rufibacter quisquiliarum TaxID=1549639 RepID=A0A839GGC9_9BACT|nr:hypothetical protein [Rufibacter quisquiliarum]MBA9075709.1 CRISPR-associated protein Csh1 [Rufibacter quisquiliarum]